MKNSTILTLCIWAFVPIFFGALAAFVLSFSGLSGQSDMNNMNYMFCTVLSGAGLFCIIFVWFCIAYLSKYGKHIDNLDAAEQTHNRKSKELEQIIKKYNELIIKSFPKSEYTKEQKEMINDFIFTFQRYFEGDEVGDNAIYPFPITKFGITNIGYEFSDSIFIISITLERPGFLIGKGGSVINSLSKYLNEHFKRTVEITIIESSVWTRVK